MRAGKRKAFDTFPLTAPLSFDSVKLIDLYCHLNLGRESRPWSSGPPIAYITPAWSTPWRHKRWRMLFSSSPLHALLSLAYDEGGTMVVQRTFCVDGR